MSSPFPGMNPYLEQETVWHDFHQTFIVAMSNALVPQVRPTYLVKLEQLLFIDGGSTDARSSLRPLAAIPPTDISSNRIPQTTLHPPVIARLPLNVDIEKHAYIEIRDRESRELITVIELLSPSNKKTGSDREQYLAKRRHLSATGVHLVELDLLRGHPRLPLENLPDCDYYAMVARAEEHPVAGIWPLRLRERLPEIPIPLRPPDPDARLDLQAVLHRVYDDAGYEDYIYRGRPSPPLHPTDAQWANEFLPSRQT